MRALVASGFVRPMENQMATPETAPKTPVRMRKNLGVTVQGLAPVVTAFAQGLLFREWKIESAADGEMRDHHVKNGDQPDDPTAAQQRHNPERIIHVSLVLVNAPITGHRQNGERANRRYADIMCSAAGGPRQWNGHKTESRAITRGLR